MNIIKEGRPHPRHCSGAYRLISRSGSAPTRGEYRSAGRWQTPWRIGEAHRAPRALLCGRMRRLGLGNSARNCSSKTWTRKTKTMNSHGSKTQQLPLMASPSHQNPVLPKLGRKKLKSLSKTLSTTLSLKLPLP